ncbi:FKBP-type peptidyl-prolyl cis-trans isomerase N-terminal domain-containing protein [Serratia sp. NPDC078593]|uniref:FKBP-type peptidyl-prolyl cis-trans isomerase N-terminal domain-containing protein n=1 Tax=unclassified Serratia (in: enterobacteria) TaxID=2647522 RepID=UPI0037D84A75
MRGQRRFPQITGLSSCRALLGMMVAGNLFVGPLALAATPTDNSGVPALLQFAEQYNDQKSRQTAPVSSKPQKNTGQANAGQKQPSAEKTSKTPTLRWQTKEAELQRQRATISQLEQKVRVLQTSLAEKMALPQPVPVPDMKGLSQLAQGLRQALAITPKEQQVVATLKREQQAALALKTNNTALQTQVNALKTALAEKKSLTTKETKEAIGRLNAQLQAVKADKITLQTHLASAQKNYQMVNISSENLKKQLVRAQEHSEQQLQQQEELKQQRQALQNEVESNVATVTALRAELAALQAKAPVLLNKKTLEKPSGRQDYAAGVSLGEEILQMQAERKKWGVNTDKQVILAGIIDTFSGQRQLSDDQLNQALMASESLVTRAREKVMAEQAKKGESYLASFKKDSRVKRTATGAWYRVDYAGDSPIPNGAALDVVVKETLTNGVVIQDMEANGAVLSQSIDKFPPLFQEALKVLRNHGSLTLVVPPELAYGEKGYPPSVPPNATMVYQLRIAEMYPPAKK